MPTDFKNERAKLLDAQSAAKAEHARTAFAAMDNPKLQTKLADLEAELTQYTTALTRLDAAERAAADLNAATAAASIDARRVAAAQAVTEAMAKAVREASTIDELISKLAGALDRLDTAHAQAADALSLTAQEAAHLVPEAGAFAHTAALNLQAAARGCQVRSPLVYKLAQALGDRPLIGPVQWPGLVEAKTPLGEAARADAAALAVITSWTADALKAAVVREKV